MLPDTSILMGQKLVKIQKSKWDILSNFQTLWISTHYPGKAEENVIIVIKTCDEKLWLLKEKNNLADFVTGWSSREKGPPLAATAIFPFWSFYRSFKGPKAKLFLPKIFAKGMIALFPFVMAIFKLHVLTSAAMSECQNRTSKFKVNR